MTAECQIRVGRERAALDVRLHPSARGCSSSSSSLDLLRLAQVGAHVMSLKVFSAPRAKKWPSLRRQPRPCGIQQPGLVGLHANLRHPLKSVASPSDLDASSRVHCRVTRSVQSANEVERFLRRAPKNSNSNNSSRSRRRRKSRVTAAPAAAVRVNQTRGELRQRRLATEFQFESVVGR